MINWIKNRLNIGLQLPNEPLVIAVDFDGTCVQHCYPNVGVEMPGATQALTSLAAEGHRLILWTCREDHPTDPKKNHLTQAIKWFKEREIPLTSINCTPKELDFRINGGRKVAAHLYIDDSVIDGFPGWNYIHKKLTGKALK